MNTHTSTAFEAWLVETGVSATTNEEEAAALDMWQAALEDEELEFAEARAEAARDRMFDTSAAW